MPFGTIWNQFEPPSPIKNLDNMQIRCNKDKIWMHFGTILNQFEHSSPIKNDLIVLHQFIPFVYFLILLEQKLT